MSTFAPFDAKKKKKMTARLRAAKSIYVLYLCLEKINSFEILEIVRFAGDIYPIQDHCSLSFVLKMCDGGMFVQKGVFKRLFSKWKDFLRQQRCWYAGSVILMPQEMEVKRQGLIEVSL